MVGYWVSEAEKFNLLIAEEGEIYTFKILFVTNSKPAYKPFPGLRIYDLMHSLYHFSGRTEQVIPKDILICYLFMTWASVLDSKSFFSWYMTLYISYSVDIHCYRIILYCCAVNFRHNCSDSWCLKSFLYLPAYKPSPTAKRVIALKDLMYSSYDVVWCACRFHDSWSVKCNVHVVFCRNNHIDLILRAKRTTDFDAKAVYLIG